MPATEPPRGVPWMRWTLLAAAAYNLSWGAFAIVAPQALFRWAGMELPRYPELWQCLGMVIGVYGIGYAAAARDPLRHWPIVLVGFLGKVAGPVGFLGAAVRGSMPWTLGWTIVTNDLVWWIPFACILVRARRAAVASAARSTEPTIGSAA